MSGNDKAVRLTPEIVEGILGRMSQRKDEWEYFSPEDSAAYAGVPVPVFKAWMDRGYKANVGMYSALYDHVTEKRLECQLKELDHAIEKANTGDPEALKLLDTMVDSILPMVNGTLDKFDANFKESSSRQLMEKKLKISAYRTMRDKLESWTEDRTRSGRNIPGMGA